LARAELARLICDPIEYYDRDWPGYRAERPGRGDAEVLTGFWLERDRLFRDQARAAIYCYDEAGFGSGVNTLRFLYAGKPVLGFYRPEGLSKTLNLSNVMQLGLEYPDLFTLLSYEQIEEIGVAVTAWVGRIPTPQMP
jgi:hypothetical protein